MYLYVFYVYMIICIYTCKNVPARTIEERSSAGIEELDLDVELFAEADDDDEEDALNFMFSLRRSG